MKADPSVARLRFDHFELDEAEARLTCAGEPVALAPKPFAVLCALARTPRQAGDEERACSTLVWGHRFVTEAVLKSAISEVRAALDDDPKQPRYIETVSRRGYRFIAAAGQLAHAKRGCRRAERRGRSRPSRSGGAHGTVPRRCRARRPHPRGRCHAGTRAACPPPFLAQSASHEDIRATPEAKRVASTPRRSSPGTCTNYSSACRCCPASGCGPTSKVAELSVFTWPGYTAGRGSVRGSDAVARRSRRGASRGGAAHARAHFSARGALRGALMGPKTCAPCRRGCRTNGAMHRHARRRALRVPPNR